VRKKGSCRPEPGEITVESTHASLGIIEQRRARLLEAMERIKQEIEDVERELAAASSEEVPPA
jgi:hypothetical protein